MTFDFSFGTLLTAPRSADLRNVTGFLTPQTRRHIRQMGQAVRSCAGPLERRFRRLLTQAGYDHLQQRELLAITPAAAAELSSLKRFFEQVGYHGRQLAKLNTSPWAVIGTLQQFDSLLEPLLEGRFAPAREQLRLATHIALRDAFYQVREAETSRMAAEIRHLEWESRRAEQKERRRISRDLHDEAGQAIAHLRLQLEMMGREAPEPLRARLAEACQLAARTAIELRRIVAALTPTALERLGLEAALRQLVARFVRSYSATVRFRAAFPGNLPTQAKEAIYRIAQECLQNIAKHSHATHINVSLVLADRHLRLRVRDNGVGFQTDKARRRSDSFGLQGMRERAALVGGILTIRGTPGKGTSVTLEVPVHSAQVMRYGKDSHIVD